MSRKLINITCCGQLKYSGSWTGTSRWKSGKFVVCGNYPDVQCQLFIDCNADTPVRTYRLSPLTVEKIVSKTHMVMSMRNRDNIYFKALGSAEQHKLEEAVKLINDIIKSKPDRLLNANDMFVIESEPASKKVSVSDSPKQFTSMKENNRTTQKKDSVEPQLFIDDIEEDFKENTFRGPGKKQQEEQFCQRGQALKSIVTGDFYNSTPAGQKSYGFFATSGSGVKRPGLMPFNPQDQAKRPRLLSDKISFSWQNRSLGQTKQTSALQGFSNLGNTCYMNAILQSLLGLDPFSIDVLYTNRKIHRLLTSSSLYGALARLMNSRSKSTESDLSRRDMLRSIKSAISSTARRFSGYQQHDAHEFLGQVLDQLKEEVTKITKATPSPHKDLKEPAHCVFVNPTQDNFEFEVLHTITCLNCQEEVAKAEQFNDLSVDLPQTSRRSIQDALDVFFKKEEIDYTCGKCGHLKSEVAHKFTRLPRILILHVKRYTYDTQIARRSKTGQNLSVCRYLTLMSHCDESTQPPPAVPDIFHNNLSPVKTLITERGDSSLCRKLEYNSSYKFKKVSNLSDQNTGSKEDEDKCGDKHDTSSDKNTGNVIELDNEKDKPTGEDNDTKLAEAIELSLLQAQEKEKEYGSFDHDTDDELEKVLELSRLESEKMVPVGHLEEKDLQKLSEEEQLELALQNSLMEESSMFYSSRKTEKDGMQASESLNVSKTCSDDKDISDSKQSFQDECTKVQESKYDGSDMKETLHHDSVGNVDKNTQKMSESTVCTNGILQDNKNSVDHRNSKCSGILTDGQKNRQSDNEHTSSDSLMQWNKTIVNNCDSNKKDATQFKESGNTTDYKHKNLNFGKGGGDPEQEGIDLRCFEEKENILPEADWCNELDVFGDTSFEQDKPKEEENEDGSLPISYRLVSIVNHIGNSSFTGHYISDVYDMKKQCWFSYDDTRVSQVTESEIRIKRQRTGYIFFYMLKDLFEEQLNVNAAHLLVSKER